MTRKPAQGAGGVNRRRAARGGLVALLTLLTLLTLLAPLTACGSPAAQPTAIGGSPTAAGPRATAPGALTLVPAPTRTPTVAVVPTPEPVFTALQALELAQPRLRQLHPRGLVMGISGSTRVGRDEYADHVREWVIDVWAPELGMRRQYGVVAGVLRDAATSSTIPPGGLAHVMALADEPIPSELIDSDRAIELADAAGAAQFKQSERAQLRTIAVSGRLDGSLVWDIFASRIGFDGATLDVVLDARTGAVNNMRIRQLGATQSAALTTTAGARR